MGDHAQQAIGDVTVTMVIERHTETPVGFLPAASADALARHREWLSPWALGDGQLRFVIQALCLEADGRKIVIDAPAGRRRGRRSRRSQAV